MKNIKDKDYLTRITLIDLKLTLGEMLVLIGNQRRLITHPEALICMPRHGRGRQVVSFFKPGGWTDTKQMVLQYAKRGLSPNPYAQAAVNLDDPAFADSHANVSFWQDKSGNYYFMIFDSNTYEERHCCVAPLKNSLFDMWFAGVPIESVI